MKANITADGTLEIIPESETEHYALFKWWEDSHTELGNASFHAKSYDACSNISPQEKDNGV